MYIPKGYGTVFPYIIVDNADEFAAFLSNVFGASELGRTILPDGRLANIRVKIGTSAFMLSQAVPGVMQAMPAAYYIYAEDVDSTFEKALTCGAEVMMEPTDMPYQDRQAGVTDPFGNSWWISKRLVEQSYDA